MAETNQYVVEHTEPTVLIDNAGKPYKGFVVTVTLTQWNESRLLEVALIDPDEIDRLVKDQIKTRKALEELGG